jgi:RNA polymerase sigma factor (sigma-70 family)
MQTLWNAFFERLLKTADKRLKFTQILTVEGEDIVASVFESVWEAAQAGRLQNVANIDELLWVLLAMTRRKCVDHLRRAQAERRGGGKQPLSLDGPAALFTEIVSAEPDPQYMAVLNDQYQQILKKLGDPVLRQIAVLRIEGFRLDEIAQQSGLAESTIRRKLRIVRRLFQDEMKQDSA